MKTTKILISIILITTLSSFLIKGNDAKIWTEQTNVKKAIKFEKSISENIEFLKQNVSLSKSSFPLVDQYDLANPIVVKREINGKLPVYAQYFFSETDSIIRFVSYDWEIDKYGNYFKKQDIWKQEAKKLDKYNRKYNQIKSFLSESIGKPRIEDSKPKVTKSKWEKEDYLSRKTEWETDKIYSSLSLVFASNTYRIRWNYYWKE